MELLRILVVGFAGIVIGFTAGYIGGFDRGHKKGYGQAKRDDVSSHRYEYGGL